MKKINFLKINSMFSKFFLITVLSSNLTPIVKASQGPAETEGRKIDNATNKFGTYLDDSTITARIKSEILSDPQLKVFQINVITTKGVVKLSGTVDSQQMINRTLEIAYKTQDVKSVDNQLNITKFVK